MKRWILPAVVAGLAAGVAALPLDWIAPFAVPSDMQANAPDLEFHGTIWDGRVTGIPVFEASNFKVSPFARRVDVQAGDGQNFFTGRVTPSSVHDVQFWADLSTFPFTDGRLQGLKGDVSFTLSEVSYDKSGCASAIGDMRTDVLQRNGGAIQWTGPELTGPIRCEGGSIIADLSGRDTEQVISALIRLVPNGSYRADITVRTERGEADVVLPLFGFSRAGGDFKLTEQGRWR